MSQRVWLASVLAVALGVIVTAVERSRSQESSQEGSQSQAEARGDFGGGFGRAEMGGEFGGAMAGEAPQVGPLPAPAIPRIWVNNDPQRTEQLYELLKAPITSAGLDFPDGTPLAEVLTFLSEEYNVPILLDPAALNELGIGVDEPVETRLKNVRLGQAMQRLLQPLELTYIVEDGIFLVTSEKQATSRLAVAVYDVRDLVHGGDYDSLIEVIISNIASDTWAENGSGNAEIRVYSQRGCLIISETTVVHEQIASLLSALRQLPIDPNAMSPSLPSGGGMGGGSGDTGCGEHEAKGNPTPALGS